MNSRPLPSFVPFRLIGGGHLQTIVGHLLPVRPMPGTYERWLIPVGGDDRLVARFYRGSSRVVNVFFHGLGGCADSKYMQVSGQAALDKGHSVLLVNHRGSGEGLLFARGLYHSGVVEDVAAVMRFVRAHLPGARVVAVGFSLSANLLLNAAGMLDRDLPDEIIAVNPPIDLHLTARRLLAPENFVYDQKFVRDLRRIFAEKVKAGMMDRVPELPRFCRLVDIDEAVTAPLGGFASRDDYYTRCSSVRYAANVSVPTLILHAEDDPFIPGETFRTAPYPSNVELKLVPRGGHVGYLSAPGPGMRWLGDFFAAAL